MSGNALFENQPFDAGNPTVMRSPRLAALAARRAPLVLGTAFFLIPLFPTFITLTGAGVPGVSVLPKPLALALLAIAVCIAAYFAFVLATTRGAHEPTVIPLATFPAAATAAALLGFDARAGALFIAILASGVMWHAVILRFFRMPHVASAIYGSFLASGALAAATAIAMVLTKTPAGLYTVGHGRAIGTFIVPGELAGYLIVYVPLAFALALDGPVRLRNLARTGLVLGAAAFVLTFSRAGWVGMAAAVTFFVFMLQGRRGARYAIAVAGVALVALGFVFNSHHDPSENFTRLSIWQAALAMIARFPLTGAGPFEFSAVYALVRLPDGEPTAFHAHSVLLTIAAEAGFIGVAAVLFGWFRFVVVFRERLRRAPGRSTLALAIGAGLVGTWVQGLIDTVSVVLFALWLPFMALALVTVESDAPEVSPAAEPSLRAARPISAGRRAATAAALSIAGIVIVAGAFVQIGSGAVFARAAAPISLAAHLPPKLGTHVYEALERVAPLPFVEAMLTDDALLRGDLNAAAAHAARMPAGTLRDEDQARIALARGRHDEAIRRFLEAGDDAALQADVRQLIEGGHAREAYALEDRVRRRLVESKTRPNAVADSWWRLGRLAVRMQDVDEADRDYARARALAPLNTKYIIESGTLALQRRQPDAARALFARAAEIDPASTDAVAGMGLAALDAGDRAEAERLLARALRLSARSALELRLQRRLGTSETP
ncbi:MAG TPA: O-antigen ligase family protein [Candidatus Elarobacter sp.]|jgi:tetratricopeptide (TPR) repeat protein